MSSIVAGWPGPVLLSDGDGKVGSDPPAPGISMKCAAPTDRAFCAFPFAREFFWSRDRYTDDCEFSVRLSHWRETLTPDSPLVTRFPAGALVPAVPRVLRTPFLGAARPPS